MNKRSLDLPGWFIFGKEIESYIDVLLLICCCKDKKNLILPEYP
jgi:hypothetical protein